jgi:hypothetical protein
MCTHRGNTPTHPFQDGHPFQDEPPFRGKLLDSKPLLTPAIGATQHPAAPTSLHFRNIPHSPSPAIQRPRPTQAVSRQRDDCHHNNNSRATFEGNPPGAHAHPRVAAQDEEKANWTQHTHPSLLAAYASNSHWAQQASDHSGEGPHLLATLHFWVAVCHERPFVWLQLAHRPPRKARGNHSSITLLYSPWHTPNLTGRVPSCRGRTRVVFHDDPPGALESHKPPL